MERIEKIFALIQWEDLFFNIIDTCNILAPRKDGCDYRCGDYIKAKFHGKIYKAIICDLDEDKTKLVSLRDDHVQRNQLKYKYLPEDERSSFVADPLPDGNQSICTAATSKRVNEETDSMEEASGIKLTPKRPRVINANTLIQSADLLPLNDQDEVQKVAKTTKMKKAVEKERKKQTDLASELVLLSNKEQLFGSQMNQEDRFNQLEQKIDDLKEVVESFMSCRQCLRKAYKGICNPTPSTPQSSSGAGIKTSGLTPCTSITKPYSEVSASASASASSITNTSSSETTAFSSTGPDPVDDDGETLLDAGVEVEDQATMQYLGDPRFGVQICSMDISRCIATAKTIEKLALNVIEFLVAPEEMPFTTMYGNKQHKKKALEENKRKALRSFLFGEFPFKCQKEMEKVWGQIVKAINDKLRKRK